MREQTEIKKKSQMMNCIKYSLICNKSSRNNYISLNAVKTVLNEVFSTANHLSKITLQKEVYLDKLKTGCVTPILKIDDRSLYANYRPNSGLLCFQKLLQRITYNRLYEFVVKNEILYEKQFRFPDTHSEEPTM